MIHIDHNVIVPVLGQTLGMPGFFADMEGSHAGYIEEHFACFASNCWKWRGSMLYLLMRVGYPVLWRSLIPTSPQAYMKFRV